MYCGKFSLQRSQNLSQNFEKKTVHDLKIFLPFLENRKIKLFIFDRVLFNLYYNLNNFCLKAH